MTTTSKRADELKVGDVYREPWFSSSVTFRVLEIEVYPPSIVYVSAYRGAAILDKNNAFLNPILNKWSYFPWDLVEVLTP